MSRLVMKPPSAGSTSVDYTIGMPKDLIPEKIKLSVQDVQDMSNDPSILAAFGLSFADSGLGNPVTRDCALSVPAIFAARRIICGSISQLPLHLFSSAKQPLDSPLFSQPEQGIARSVTIANLVEDLWFYKVAYLLVTQRDVFGIPTKVQFKNQFLVTPQNNGTYVIEGRTYSSRDVIQFISPALPLLKHSAAIRSAVALEGIASILTHEGVLRGYFTPAEGQEEDPDPQAVVEALNAWILARQNRSFGYVPSALKFVETNPDLDKLQLPESRQHAVLEISRLTGISPHRLGVPIDSTTYQNVEQDNQSLYRETLMPFILAIEERLNMGDVTRVGNYAKFSLDAFLRADTASRYAAYSIALGGKPFMTVEEVRALEELPADVNLEPISPKEPPNA